VRHQHRLALARSPESPTAEPALPLRAQLTPPATIFFLAGCRAGTGSPSHPIFGNRTAAQYAVKIELHFTLSNPLSGNAEKGRRLVRVSARTACTRHGKRGPKSMPLRPTGSRPEDANCGKSRGGETHTKARPHAFALPGPSARNSLDRDRKDTALFFDRRTSGNEVSQCDVRSVRLASCLAQRFPEA
jgi:hypothetical protein